MECKVIGSNKTARELLKRGHMIEDIKPHKNDHRRTVFVFKLTDALLDDLKQLEV